MKNVVVGVITIFICGGVGQALLVDFGVEWLALKLVLF
jgi:hypothetical protein